MITVEEVQKFRDSEKYEFARDAIKYLDFVSSLVDNVEFKNEVAYFKKYLVDGLNYVTLVSEHSVSFTRPFVKNYFESEAFNRLKNVKLNEDFFNKDYSKFNDSVELSEAIKRDVNELKSYWKV